MKKWWKALRSSSQNSPSSHLRRGLDTALGELNGDPDDIVAFLEAEKVQGRPLSDETCAIAVFIKDRMAQFQDLVVKVTSREVKVIAVVEGVETEVGLAIAHTSLAAVIKNFDLGSYQQLESWGDEPTTQDEVESEILGIEPLPEPVG